MSSIMRARNGLMGRSEVSEVIGALSRAEGWWTFDARDRMPRSSRATARHPVDNARTATLAPSRASGFVQRPKHDDQCASLECPRLEKAAVRPLLSPCGFVAPMMPFAIRQRFPETGRSKFFGTGLMRHLPGFEQAILQMQ